MIRTITCIHCGSNKVFRGRITSSDVALSLIGEGWRKKEQKGWICSECSYYAATEPDYLSETPSYFLREADEILHELWKLIEGENL